MKAVRLLGLLVLPVLFSGSTVTGAIKKLLPAQQQAKYSIKVADTAPPKELDLSIQKLLGKQAIQLYDAGGKMLAEYWFRAEIPAEATAEQLKNGLTYREVPETTLLGAVRFEQDARDYRKQKVKAGLYTLRLAYQPMDGDHAGSSDSQEFLVVIGAKADKRPSALDSKMMIKASADSIGTGHPAVFMLFPNSKPAAKPELAAKPKSHYVVNTQGAVIVGGKKTGTALGISLTVVGHAD